MCIRLKVEKGFIRLTLRVQMGAMSSFLCRCFTKRWVHKNHFWKKKLTGGAGITQYFETDIGWSENGELKHLVKVLFKLH
jgi:hypothetical protein